MGRQVVVAVLTFLVVSALALMILGGGAGEIELLITFVVATAAALVAARAARSKSHRQI